MSAFFVAILIFVGIIAAIAIVLAVVRFVLQNIRMRVRLEPIRVFLVLLPRETSPAEEKQNDDNKQKEFEKYIAQAESMMAAIGGLKAQRGIRAWFLGREDEVSFEVVVKHGRISFYMVVPDNLVNYMVQQIRSSYEDVELEEVEDYNLFTANSKVRGAYLKQTKEHYYPIKTYKDFESDPFNGLINVLSKLGDKESAVVQFVVRSAPAKWRMSGKQAVSKIQRGEGLLESSEPVLVKVISSAGKIAKENFTSPSPEEKRKEDDDKPKRLTPKEEELAKKIEDKSAKAGLDTNIRVLVTGENIESIKMQLDSIVNNFSQYNVYEYGNAFSVVRDTSDRIAHNFIFRRFNEKRNCIFNTEELISLFHFPLPSTSAPNIKWLTSRKAPAPVNTPTEGMILGKNIYRNEERLVYMGQEDRRRHVHIIGTTGVGKSVLMYNMALQDIVAGRGVGVVDPHGDFVEHILENVPKERYEDVILFDPSNTDYPIGLNMLEAQTPEEKDFVVQEMISIFYKLVPNPEMIGPMFEHNMRNAMLTLMANDKNPGTMAEVPRIFTDSDFQKELLKGVTDPVVRAFWEKEMAKTSDFHKSEMLGYLISKVGRFVENEMIRNIIGQSKSGIDFKRIMQTGKILLVNLSKGLVGEINSSLLGLIVVSKIQMAAFAQAKLPEDKRRDFYLYIDEFQNYTTDSIATILSEARKYRLNLTMAHQYLGQLTKANDTSIRDAVLGNVGTMVSFRIGVEDAPTIAQQMAPVFSEYDLVNLERFNACVKMLVNNTVERAFSLQTFAPAEGSAKQRDLLKELSGRKYGREKKFVEKEILERSKLGEVIKKADTGDIETSL